MKISQNISSYNCSWIFNLLHKSYDASDVTVYLLVKFITIHDIDVFVYLCVGVNEN